jgi:tRNA U34 5-methylaminomethyl-2-thiouridine-forming methyltransferase MnmC
LLCLSFQSFLTLKASKSNSAERPRLDLVIGREMAWVACTAVGSVRGKLQKAGFSVVPKGGVAF